MLKSCWDRQSRSTIFPIFIRKNNALQVMFYGCSVFFRGLFPGDTSSGAHSSDVASRSSLSKDFHKLESSQESAKTRPLLQRQHVF